MINKYYIITDMHLATKLNARFDYYQECVEMAKKIISIKNERDSVDTKHIAIYLGDLAHKDDKYTARFNKVNDILDTLLEAFDESYLNIGNHEITYQKNNPVLKKVGELNHPQITQIDVNNIGIVNQLKVVDRLCDGEVNFDFYPYNKYQVGFPTEPNKYTIGLSHAYYVTLQENHDLYLKEKTAYHIKQTSNLLCQPDIIFNGHAHLAIGKIKVGTTDVVHLGSLARTNVTEVDNEMLNRVIPVITVTDGILDRDFEYVPITLPRRENVVDESKVQDDLHKRKRTLRNKRVLSKAFLNVDTPDDYIKGIGEILVDKFGEDGRVFFDYIMED